MKATKTRVLLTAAGLSVAVLSTAVLSTAGLAQEGPGRGMMFPFETVDADKDGRVTKAELDAFRAAEASAMDANTDGKLTAEELGAAFVARMTARATTMGEDMVARLDTDGDKALSAAELAARPMPAMFFEKADADGDGAVTRAEADALRERMQDRKDGRGKDGRGKDGRGWGGQGEGGHGEGGHGPHWWGMMGDD